MKNLKLTIVIFLFILFAFVKVNAQTYKINVSKSIVNWEGKKITGQHEGTMNFKDGFLVFKDKKVVGGSFTVDMKSLSNKDQTGSSKLKLEGHLKSADFFSVDNFPISTLVFKNIASKGAKYLSYQCRLNYKRNYKFNSI